MKLILNIGLAVGTTSSIAASVALEIVKANGLIVHRHKVLQSDTEQTLVCEVSADPLSPVHRRPTAVFSAIAEDLQQDCIAVYSEPIKTGVLVGPRASAWGPFNPEFFFQLDGTRLAQPTPAAA